MARPALSSRQTTLLLEALVASPDLWRYGYDLSRETGLKPGTLYPLLMRLEGMGWLETRWGEPDASGRPPRHFYRLTGVGQEEAAKRIEAARASEVASTILQQQEGLS